VKKAAEVKAAAAWRLQIFQEDLSRAGGMFKLSVT
jgi:hypothetical protein